MADFDPSGLEHGLGKITEAITAGDTVGGITITELSATPSIGQLATVNDADAGLAWGDTAVNTGAGATSYKVWWNGVHWTVIGK